MSVNCRCCSVSEYWHLPYVCIYHTYRHIHLYMQVNIGLKCCQYLCLLVCF